MDTYKKLKKNRKAKKWIVRHLLSFVHGVMRLKVEFFYPGIFLVNLPLGISEGRMLNMIYNQDSDLN